MSVRELIFALIIDRPKTTDEVVSELGMKRTVVQNHLSRLCQEKAATKYRVGPLHFYQAADLNNGEKFDRRICILSANTAPLIGRCDFAASWVPRQELTV